MKEKKLLKRIIVISVMMIALYIGAIKITDHFAGVDYRSYLFSYDIQEPYISCGTDRFDIRFSEEGMIRVESLTKEHGCFFITLSGLKEGDVWMNVYDRENGVLLESNLFKIYDDGWMLNHKTGNFPHYRLYHLYMIIFTFIMTALLWISFYMSQRMLRYSYQSIFFSGIALWNTMILFLLIYTWTYSDTMISAYDILQDAAESFIRHTMPVILLFCSSLTISNISLIKHEGFRVQNALGIMISVIMVAGAMMVFVFGKVTGSWMEQDIYQSLINIYYAVYAFMECFLFGSVLCGILAAKHQPSYDVDYIIILGCKVRKDGTLYPLIRGRVDRAISHYKEQMNHNGKAAVFVPSGGKGGDESLAEAEAMKNYLLEQGIPEEHILVENQSANTLQNMDFSKKLIHEKKENAKIAFSTTNYHVFRSGIISRQVNFEPEGMGSKTKWYFWPNAFIREVIGMMSYKWKEMIMVMIPIAAFIVSVQFLY